MRIAIMGTGGVGGYFGGLLARAGQDVTFIARGEHLRAIRDQGLQVQSIHGDFTVMPARATDTPAELGPVDCAIVATKTYQLEEAAEALRPAVGPQTAVLPLLNGVDASERLAALLGPEAVLGGVCYVGSMISAAGVVRQESEFRRVIAGELDGTISARVKAIVEALNGSGATAEASTDIQKARWTKFAFIAPFSGVGAVARVPAGEINAVPETRALLAQAVGEIEAVARAVGIALDPEITPHTIAFCDNLQPHITASMQRDILDGRRSELDSIIGIVVHKGHELGVPVPAFEYFYASLLPQERRARRKQ